MRTVAIKPPQPVLGWDDANKHLNFPPASDQPLVEGMIAAATASIDGLTGRLGRAIGPQQLEARFDGFDDEPLRLACPPIARIVSVTYNDPTGAAVVLLPAAYRLIDREVVPAFGTSWPNAMYDLETVQVRYWAGYVADPAADPLVAQLPPAIRAAILLMVGDLYENRSTTLDARAAGAAAVPMSTTVEALLGPFRVFS